MMLLIFTLSASSTRKSVPLRETGEEVKTEQQWGQRRIEKTGQGRRKSREGKNEEIMRLR